MAVRNFISRSYTLCQVPSRDLFSNISGFPLFSSYPLDLVIRKKRDSLESLFFLFVEIIMQYLIIWKKNIDDGYTDSNYVI